MRLVRFTHPRTGAAPRVGISTAAGILDPASAWDSSRRPFPSDPVALLASRDARDLCGELIREGGSATVYPAGEVILLAPLARTCSFRDFYAFEEHVRNARAR